MIVFGIDCNFFIFYLFDWKLVDLMIFSFLQGKMWRPKDRVRLTDFARPMPIMVHAWFFQNIERLSKFTVL